MCMQVADGLSWKESEALGVQQPAAMHPTLQREAERGRRGQ